MEAGETGFDKIIQEYSNADETLKPFICSTSEHFALVLPDLTYKDGIKDDTLPVVEFVPVSKGSAHYEKILSFCYKQACKSSDNTLHLGLSDLSYFRKNVLENLVKKEYLIKEKISGVSLYKANKEIIRLQ